MKRFQRILAYCPHADCEENLFEWCRVIASRAEPKLIDVVRCLEDVLPEYPLPQTGEDILDAERAELEKASASGLSDVIHRTRVLSGQSLKTLLGLLADGSYDLVIIPVDDPASRNFAERLARKSPVGVLITPPGRKPHFARVLMATDFSDLAPLTMEWAEAFCQLAKRPPELMALHVMHMPNNSRATLAIQSESLRNAIYNTSHKTLREFIEEHAKLTGHWTYHVAENPLAGPQLLAEANSKDADLIVMGSHGRNALSIALLGGETTTVIRKTERPVLVVKRKNESLGLLRELLGQTGLAIPPKVETERAVVE